MISILNSSHLDISTGKNQFLEIICNVTDKYILRLDFGIMYGKILKLILRQQYQHTLADAESGAHARIGDQPSYAHMEGAEALEVLSLRLVQANTACDKLAILVEILQVITDIYHHNTNR